MQQFVTLVCSRIQAFTDSEILALVPAETLKAIKEKDPHPFFQAYSICHEGVSMPRLIGDTAKPIHWTKKAVQSIKNVIKNGVKFFLGHNEDNSTTGRRELGEVVHSFEKEIDGALHHVVISYHSPDVREEVKKYDICSQEAEWSFFDVAGNLIADAMDKMTGIALQSSSVAEPAFSGARRLGLVQAFGAENLNNNKGGQEMPLDLTTVTFNDLIAEVKRRNTFPSQIYSLDEIKADNKIKPTFDEVETLKGQVKTKDEEIKQLKTNQEELNKKTQLSTAKQRFTNLLNGGDVKLTDLQKNYMEKKFKEDKISDLTDEGLKKLRDDLLVSYQEDVAIFGTGDKTIPGTGGGSGTIEKDDLTKASNNELLAEDVSLQ